MKPSYIQHPDYDSVVNVGGESLRCYSPKQFALLSLDGNFIVSGSCSLSRGKSGSGAIGDLTLSQRSLRLFPADRFGGPFCRTVGYVAVGDNRFVAVTKRVIPLALWLVLGVILAILAAALLLPRTDGESVAAERQTGGSYEVTGEKRERVEAEAEVEKQTDYITFTGYGEYTVDALNPSVEFTNPIENTAIMFYAVYDKTDGTLIAQTDGVAPGEYAYVNVYDYFGSPGEYIVHVVTETESPEGEPLSGVDNDMRIIVQ